MKPLAATNRHFLAELLIKQLQHGEDGQKLWANPTQVYAGRIAEVIRQQNSNQPSCVDAACNECEFLRNDSERERVEELLEFFHGKTHRDRRGLRFAEPSGEQANHFTRIKWFGHLVAHRHTCRAITCSGAARGSRLHRSPPLCSLFRNRAPCTWFACRPSCGRPHDNGTSRCQPYPEPYRR